MSVSCAGRKLWTMALLAFSLLACPLVAPHGVHAAGWRLMLSDDFDGDSLDRKRWATRYIFSNERLDHLWQNGEEQRYRDDGNHLVQNGILSLIAKRVEGQPHKYESGMIRSYETFYYGYFEARVKSPPGVGSWPAFWLLPDQDENGDTDWPPEIDIFDNANNGREDDIFTIRSGVIPVPDRPGSGELTWQARGFDAKNSNIKVPTSLADGFNVYGLVWTPTEVTAFFNGRRLYTRRYPWENKDGRRPGPAHVLLNLAVGGPWAGQYGVDDSAFPQSFEIDYVRVCQFEAAATAGERLCGGGEFTPDPAQYAAALGEEARDLDRTRFGDAVMERSRSNVRVRIPLRGGMPSRDPLQAFLYLTGPNNKLVRTERMPLPVPSTEWQDKDMELAWDLTLPETPAKGEYRLFLSIGKAEDWDPRGLEWVKAITLEHSGGDTLNRRAGQPLRYQVGNFVVE